MIAGPSEPLRWPGPFECFSMFKLRAMQVRDIPAVMSIQEESYSAEVLESEAVICNRLAACPQLAWVAEDDQGVCAYLFAYHSRVGKVTPLDGEFQEHTEADCLYLHDLAVARRASGRGIGPALVQRNLAQARTQQLRYSALVSVQESEAFWSRLGYAAHTELEAPQVSNLDSYQIPAVYMVRALH
jgi:predicted N-acetyltransferase YhbS